MSNPITWRFENTPLWFTSTKERLSAHINKARRDLEVHPDEKIIYSNDRPIPTDVSDNIDNTGDLPVTPVAKSKRTPPVQTNNMSDVPDLVGEPVFAPTPIPTPDGNSGSGNFGPGL